MSIIVLLTSLSRSNVQRLVASTRQQGALDRQRAALTTSIAKLEKGAAGKSGDQKKSAQVAARRKKLARHGYEKNEHGHRFSAQGSCDATAVRGGAINGVDESSRKQAGHSLTKLRANGATSIALGVDRESMFRFPSAGADIGGGAPLLQLRAVSCGFTADEKSGSGAPTPATATAAVPSLFASVDLDIMPHARVALLGRNGSGKSTLLRILAAAGGDSGGVKAAIDPEEAAGHCGNALPAITGEARRARGARIAYFSQHVADAMLLAGGDGSAIDLLAGRWPVVSEQDVRARLGAFGVGGDLAPAPLSSLSGGQRCRVALAALAHGGADGTAAPHVMLLDKPTNHLDADSVRALGEALRAFEGAVILVSHDVRLMRVVCGDTGKGIGCSAGEVDVSGAASGFGEFWALRRRRLERVDGGLDGYLAEMHDQLKRGSLENRSTTAGSAGATATGRKVPTKEPTKEIAGKAHSKPGSRRS